MTAGFSFIYSANAKWVNGFMEMTQTQAELCKEFQTATGLWQPDVLFATGLIKARILSVNIPKLSECCSLRSNLLHSINHA